MKCKNCGTELTEGEHICPECGTPAKQSTPLGVKIGLIVAVVVIIIAGFLLCFRLLTRGEKNNDTQNLPNPNEISEPSSDPATDDLTSNGDAAGNTVQTDGVSYTVEADALTDEMLDRVVATYGDHTLTNRTLALYYWQGFTSFCNNYSSYLPYILDITQPLDQQVYDSATGQTWQEYFLEYALNTFVRTSAICDAADEAGFQLDQAYLDSLDSVDSAFAENAADIGGSTADDYAAYLFGKGVSVEDYCAFMHSYLTQGVYSTEIYAAIQPTDAEIEAFYDENAETYVSDGVEKDDTHLISVRHILLQPSDMEDEEAVAQTKAEAEALLKDWKAGEASEESFAALAKEKSTDPGSKDNGGLYTGVYPGQMVQAFNDWCFDASRKPGDSGIVETSYGFHVMYFVEKEPTLYWHYKAQSDLIAKTYSDQIAALVASNTLDTTYDNIVIVTPAMMAG